ncbi:MAG: 23S rRNA (pseudouridine(1915)-N(3))-methyltransferase RlmH [Rhodospirillales bacterium]|nr:23S rRNA (pseudouridine(1915)-N(3))-methyltransferase RlmH [Rhodospirillales bacterium]
MEILIVTVGKFGKGKAHAAEKAIYEQYAGRISPPPKLTEVEEKRPLPSEQRKRREGELLRAALPNGAVVVALDERGRNISSNDLATKIESWRDSGRRSIAFLIGGADGLDNETRRRADMVVSLGKMTWPHLLVRGMLAEQIFRAQSILAGHPYHRA